MKIEIPLLHQRIENEQVVNTEESIIFDIDTSVYSEERWEQHFPRLAEKEGLFDYISRVQEGAISDRVKVSCMLKALFCFIESDRVSTYKEFAQMFILSNPEYTNKLIEKLRTAFKIILGSSAVKN